jgi:hypothetical protein
MDLRLQIVSRNKIQKNCKKEKLFLKQDLGIDYLSIIKETLPRLSTFTEKMMTRKIKQLQMVDGRR